MTNKYWTHQKEVDIVLVNISDTLKNLQNTVYAKYDLF